MTTHNEPPTAPDPPGAEAAAPREAGLTLPVTGMTCASCVRRVEGPWARWTA